MIENHPSLEKSTNSGGNITRLISIVSGMENTPELQEFWKKQYLDLWSKEWFSLDSKIIDLILNQTLSQKPVTPIGYINLEKFVVQETKPVIKLPELEEAVELAVRFLDSSLLTINFSPEAGDLVQQYRKIGVGVKLSAELENKYGREIYNDFPKEIANTAYRTSEHLAEEKGQPKSWQKINRNLQNKSYEYWFNTESGELISASDMFKKVSSESEISEDWQIVARRNSHLLTLPKFEPWEKWNDRLEQKTEPKKESEEKTLESKPDIKIEDITEKQIQTSRDNLEIIPLPNSLEPNIDITPPQEMLKEKTKTDLENTQVQQTSNKNALFQEGELVKTIDSKNNPKIAQIIESKEEDGQWLYRLSGDSKNEENEWVGENQLEEIDVKELLANLNKPTNKAKAVLLSHDLETKQWLVNGEKQIPIIEVENDNQFLDIAETISEKTGYAMQDLRATTNFKDEANTLWMAYALSSHQAEAKYNAAPNNINLIPAPLLTLGVQEVERKNSEKAKMHQELSKEWENEKSKLVSQIKRETILELNKNQVAPGQSNSSVLNSNLSTTTNDKLNYSQTMSKYSLKLQQLVKTNAFGDLAVDIVYDDEGPKVVSASGGNLNPELKQTLDTFLMLVNFTLAKKIAPAEIAKIISEDPKSGNKLPINDLLKVIGASLKDAPENADKINGSILSHVGPEIVGAVMQSFNQGKPFNFESQKPMGGNNQSPAAQQQNPNPGPNNQAEKPSAPEAPKPENGDNNRPNNPESPRNGGGIFNPFAKSDRNE